MSKQVTPWKERNLTKFIAYYDFEGDSQKEC